jgi:hypothetical protein
MGTGFWPAGMGRMGHIIADRGLRIGEYPERTAHGTEFAPSECGLGIAGPSVATLRRVDLRAADFTFGGSVIIFFMAGYSRMTPQNSDCGVPPPAERA